VVEFGKRGGGGRRDSARLAAEVDAVVVRRLSSHLAEVVDISTTGAGLLCDVPLQLGEELGLKVQGLNLFGTVVRAEDGVYGFRFDELLTSADLDLVRREVNDAVLLRMTPEQKRALEAWKLGRLD
jgi:hypothetical protein